MPLSFRQPLCCKFECLCVYIYLYIYISLFCRFLKNGEDVSQNLASILIIGPQSRIANIFPNLFSVSVIVSNPY